MKRQLFFLICFGLSSWAQAQKWDSSFQSTYYDQKLTLFRLLPDTKGEIVFLGNSITDIGEWAEIWQNSRVKNRGISGDITFGVLARMDEVISAKPKKIFVMIGVNDIARNIPDSVILNNYRRLMDRVRAESPRTQLIMQSVLPTNNQFKPFKNHYGKDDHIRAVNAGLRQLCTERGIDFVDLYVRFLDESGRLDSKYTNDGLHLNGSGYMLWKQILIEQKFMH
ncbi:MAG: GDSL-type esterase/lipase family protein [Bacteroidota bacterium]